MNWAFLFGFTNVVALAGWVMLAVLPRGPKADVGRSSTAGVALLCLAYAVLFVLLFGNLVDPGAVAGRERAGRLPARSPGSAACS